MNPEGYFSDQEKTNYDVGFGDCRPATNPEPDFGTGVVTPHASFLAMMFERGEATANLIRIQQQARRLRSRWLLRRRGRSTARSPAATSRSTRPWSWAPWATCSERALLRKAFSTPDVEKALRPVIGIEEFGAGIVGE